MRHILSAILFLGLSAAVLAGQIPEGVEGPYEPHPEAKKALSQLLSPYCPGLMLELCPAEPSRALRDSIHGMAIQGRTADELVDWVLANHGEVHRAVPLRSGFGLWAWIVPPAVLLLGLAGVIGSMVRTRGSAVATSGPAGFSDRALTPEEAARLQAALGALDHPGDLPL